MKKVIIFNWISSYNTPTSYARLKVTLVCILLSFGFTSTTLAQLKRLPVQRKSSSSVLKSGTEANRTKAVSLSLPFWDDFSFTPVNDTSNAESNFPLPSLWAKGNKVWINNGLGINPPTINVASFDGLNEIGLPYSNEVLATGFRDTLESQPINLDEVLPADTSSVFLSFFYQWQGNGEAPDATDYLQIQFKNNLGAWVNVMRINSTSSLDKTVFYYAIIKVKDTAFFHENFQFQFWRYGRESGPFDTWNIDYVYLNKGRTISENSFPDRAAASSISSLFGKYNAVPIKHFFASPKMDSVLCDVKSLDNEPEEAVDYHVYGKFINYGSSTSTYSKKLIHKGKIGVGGIITDFERIRQKFSALPDASDVLQFNPDADSIMIELRMKFNSGDSIDAERFAFEPIELKINDTISTRYYLNDYYAYDDGTAEYSATLTQSGNRMAYQFTRPKNIPDSLAVLNGFDIYFPDFGVVDNPAVEFFVYDDDNGMPGDILYSRNYLIEKKGINKFQWVRIGGEPFSVDTVYYIGWNQPISGNVKVGLDYSNNTGDRMRVYDDGVWSVNDIIEGSLMIRPHFGKADIITAIPEEEVSLQVFPNPSKGEFYVKGKYDRMEIITLTGQSISFTTQQQEENARITIANPTSGLYILKIVRGTSLETRKIIIE